jgi:hypothetical protein
VDEHEAGEGEEHGPAELEQHQGAGSDATGAGLREVEGVHGDDGRERQQPQQVHLVEVTGALGAGASRGHAGTLSSRSGNHLGSAWPTAEARRCANLRRPE